MISAYEHLAASWEKFWTRDDGDRKVALDSVDLLALDQASRVKTLAALSEGFRRLAEDETVMAAGVGAPTRCGYDPSLSLELSTDSERCVIDTSHLEKIKRAMPCEDVFDAAMAHEVFHKTQCDARRGTTPDGAIAAVHLTPAGKLREEIAAYRAEIAALEGVWSQAKATCCQGWVGTIHYLKITTWPHNETQYTTSDTDPRVHRADFMVDGLLTTVSQSVSTHVHVWDKYCGVVGEDTRSKAEFSGAAGKTTVSVRKDGSYSLGFESKEFEGESHSNTTGCKAKGTGCVECKSKSTDASWKWGGASAMVEGKIDPKKPDVLSGHFKDRYDMAVDWNLRRCSSK